MWLTSILSTGAGFTWIGLGALGETSWESLDDRRRIRHGAVLLAIGSALAFASLVGSGMVAIDVLQRLALLEVTLLLVASLVVARFGEEPSRESLQRARVVLERPVRRDDAAGFPLRLAQHEADVERLVASADAHRAAFERARLAAPPPPRPVAYQPPMVH